MAPPITKLVNLTLLPMMVTRNASTSFMPLILGPLFVLFLYFAIVKGVIVMIYSIPQSFPDRSDACDQCWPGRSWTEPFTRRNGFSAAAAGIAIGTVRSLENAGINRINGLIEANKKSAAQSASESESKPNQNNENIKPSKDRDYDISGAFNNR